MFRDNSAMRKHLHTHGPRVHVCAECGKVCLYVKLYFMTLAPSTLVGFHERLCIYNQTIHIKKEKKTIYHKRTQITIGVTHTLALLLDNC
jgi:hypothetical protein